MGGAQNTASAAFSTIAGGCRNYIASNGNYHTIGGGVFNCINVLGGACNNNFIGGGQSNEVGGNMSFGAIVSGCCNAITINAGRGNIIGAGELNDICNSTNRSAIVAGCVNEICNSCQVFIGAGLSNGIYTTNAFESAIVAGNTNRVCGGKAFIGAGANNCISSAGTWSAILGGCNNNVNKPMSFALGCSLSTACGCTTYMNNTVIGCHLQVGGTSTLNTTAGRIDATNDVVAFATSDKRLKCCIKPIKNALCKVIGVSGNTFSWKELTPEEVQNIHGNKGKDVGVIAQEIESILPEAVTTRDNGYKAVNYEKIIPLLIEAVKDLTSKVEKLESKNR